MSLQWTFIATFLYSEIILVVLLMLPFVSPQTWQKIFRSRLLKAFSSYANLYFNIFICVLVVLFLDGVRDVRRYSAPIDESDVKNNPQAEIVLHMKLFRAQRNFYIAGFALFLFLVLRKMVTLISAQAVLMAESEAARKQAQSATDAAQRIMDAGPIETVSSSSSKEKTENEENEKGESEVEKEELRVARKELEKLREDLNRAHIDVATMRKQTESTNTEYDRLLKEHTDLQKELEALTDSVDKKSD